MLRRYPRLSPGPVIPNIPNIPLEVTGWGKEELGRKEETQKGYSSLLGGIFGIFGME
jgi:hypothetical protein